MAEDSGDDGQPEMESNGDVSLPQKRHYRQRAHSNPIADHCFDYPPTPNDIDWKVFYPQFASDQQVDFLDIGCGYGGLLAELSPLFPDKLMLGIVLLSLQPNLNHCLLLGIEIRVKVSDFVVDRIKALRLQNPGLYTNISCIRSNAMKYLPNFLHKGQLSKVFFLFPDPHFKKQKHKWRIISPQLLSEYAFFLKIGGAAYIATDVPELYDWMVKHFGQHPLFIQVPEEAMKKDCVIKKIPLTEEGKKVARNNGKVFMAVFERIADPQSNV